MNATAIQFPKHADVEKILQKFDDFKQTILPQYMVHFRQGLKRGSGELEQDFVNYVTRLLPRYFQKSNQVKFL